MNVFKDYHPIVNFLYFTAVIVCAMFLMHPVCLVISFVCGFIYSVILNGKKTIRFYLFCLLPIMALAAIINPLFNYDGVTVLSYLPNGRPITAESLTYGIAAAFMLANVISWFSCYNKIMTSDKFIYLFGRIIPSMSLVFSMTLRFVPRFKSQIKVISQAQRCIGMDASQGNIIKKAKSGLTILSIMITWALEDSIKTADSMKSRGYGLSGRGTFSIFIFCGRDRAALVCIIALCVYMIIGIANGNARFTYFPSITKMVVSPLSISVFAVYFALCSMPVIMELWEMKKWKSIESKI